MKKFILPLMLLLIVGSLLAVESDPSAVVGYVKYDCVAGLNLIALPMDQGYALASAVGTDYAAIEAINYWDATTQSWFSAVYYPDFEIWDPDFAVESGDVLMITTPSSFAFYSIGDMPAQNGQYPLVAGLNTIMVPLNRSDLTFASELGTEIASAEAVNTWDAPTQSWFSAVYYPDFEIWDPDFSVSIGMPLMSTVLTPSTWPTGPRGIGSFGLKQSKN